MKDSVEQISKAIPIISIILLLSSIIKNSLYYSNFGINISEFIDLSEFPLLFINDLPFYLVFLFSLLFYLPLIYLRIYVRNKFGAESFTFSRTKKFAELVIPASILTIFLILFFKFSIETKITVIQTNIIIVISLTLLYIDRSIEFSKKYLFWSSLVIMILFSGMNAFSEIDIIESGKSKKCVTFISNNKTIKTNNIIIFLGKTKNYIFIYDLLKKQTLVFDFNKIENFIVKNNCK